MWVMVVLWMSISSIQVYGSGFQAEHECLVKAADFRANHETTRVECAYVSASR